MCAYMMEKIKYQVGLHMLRTIFFSLLLLMLSCVCILLLFFLSAFPIFSFRYRNFPSFFILSSFFFFFFRGLVYLVG